MKYIILVLLLSGCNVEAVEPIISKNFEVYQDITWTGDNLLNTKQLPAFNLAPESGVYWQGDKHTDDPSESATKSHVMSFAYNEQRYLNIEHLPYRYDRTTVEEQLNTVRKLSNILHWAKTQRPDIEVGIYSQIVEKVFCGPGTCPQEYYERNRRFRSLCAYVDVNYISMYTWFVDRPDLWLRGLQTAIQESQGCAKKTIVFIWPHYHSPANSHLLIPGDEWRAQLEAIYRLADGVVIWDKKTCNWQDINCADSTDPTNWLYQTEDFIKSKGL